MSFQRGEGDCLQRSWHLPSPRSLSNCACRFGAPLGRRRATRIARGAQNARVMSHCIACCAADKGDARRTVCVTHRAHKARTRAGASCARAGQLRRGATGSDAKHVCSDRGRVNSGNRVWARACGRRACGRNHLRRACFLFKLFSILVIASSAWRRICCLVRPLASGLFAAALLR